MTPRPSDSPIPCLLLAAIAASLILGACREPAPQSPSALPSSTSPSPSPFQVTSAPPPDRSPPDTPSPISPVASPPPHSNPAPVPAPSIPGATPPPLPASTVSSTPSPSVQIQVPPTLSPPPSPAQAASPVPPLPAAPPPSVAIAQKLATPQDLSDPAKRAALVRQIRSLENQEQSLVAEKARRLGLPLSGTLPNGRPFLLRGFEGDSPIYESPDNLNAAISTNAHLVRATAPFSVEGSGLIAGLWESGGIPRLTHQEFGGRIVSRDGSTTATSHASHVAGTIMASGINPAIQGMAPLASLDAYNSTNDLSEMTAAGAAFSGEPGKIQLSNHSYGSRRGWYDDGVSWLGVFSDDGNPSNDVDHGFGRYDSNAAALDGMTHNLPYYLPFFSNGNMRNVGPPPAGSTWYQGIGGTARTYNPATHPAGNGVYKNQYDTMDGRKTAKNILSIGAVNDAVANGQRLPANGTLTSFSSSGPTDDGRIKPDLVANGASLTSTGSSSDTNTYSSSGTSMSTPNAMGSTLLLLDYYRQRFPGQSMRASTIKALLIHTADDIGNPGPDYLYGWGLVNTLAAAQVIKQHADGGSNPFIIEDILTSTAPAKSHSFSWNGIDPIRVTLCWTDPPGQPVSGHDDRSPRLVNNLNLSLSAPDGSTHLPFVMPYVGNWSNTLLSAPAVTGVNNVDTVEQVHLPSPPRSGLYTATINHAGSLADGQQRFSLVITGGGTPDPLIISPITGFDASGQEGGPFTPSQTAYTLSNTSNSPVTWSASADVPWISLSQTGGVIPVGESASITVSIAPGAASLPVGHAHGLLTISDSTHQVSRSRPLNLHVLGFPRINVEHPADSPLANGLSLIDFNTVPRQASAIRRLFIRNSGDAILNLGPLLVEGEHAGEFTLSAPSSSQINPGQIATLDVTFSPASAGARFASLSLSSDDPDSNPFTIDLTGQGWEPQPGVTFLGDINASPAGLSPLVILSMGEYFLFTASTPHTGIELWRSNGTAAGTFMLREINPGTASATPQNLTRVGPLAFFSATHPLHGTELWVTDGTPSGTRLVRDINPGSASSSPAGFIVSGSTLFFRAATPSNGVELWKSDGSESGTVMVADINPGTSSSSPANPALFQGSIYFAAFTSNHGVELWKSDGTPAGTVLVRDLNPGTSSSTPSNFTVVGPDLFFTATTDSGAELWKTDGTPAGTSLVKDILPGSSGSSPQGLTVLNNLLYFRASSSDSGSELWCSDGSTAGTTLVRDINPGTASGLTSNPVAFNNRLYFSATDGSSGFELWSSDGSSQGTSLVRDIFLGSSSSTPVNFLECAGRLFFSAFNAQGRELWKTDGTFAGTSLVRDIHFGSGSSSPSLPVVLNDLLFFFANDGQTGIELWRSDGSSPGTFPVMDAVPGSASSSLANLANADGSLYFSANNGLLGSEPWRSTGSLSGTSLVRDLNAGTASSTPSNFTALNSLVCFSATDFASGLEPRITNGTSNGTILLREIVSGSSSSSPASFLRVRNQVFFAADNAVTGPELWRTDGTTAGTSLVLDINPGLSTSSPVPLINYRGVLYFRATTTAFGSELWRSDGTPAGTWLVKDIATGSTSSSPSEPAIVDGLLYFTASTPEDGAELWRTDGTSDGTFQVASILPGPSGSAPSNLTALGSTLFFSARGPDGTELWRSDGTSDGTFQVLDLFPGSSSSNPSNLCSTGGFLCFTADDGVRGAELWRSNGTPAGTALLADIHPGPSGSRISSLVNMAGILYFAADDGTHGAELWTSDGTPAGTTLLSDLFPGPLGSEPSLLTPVGHRLYFSAVAPGIGAELFHIERSVPAQLQVSHPAHTPLFSGVSTLSLGSTAVLSPVTRTITLRNTGTLPLTLGSIQISGTHASRFSAGLPSQNRLFGNDSATLDVTFTPDAIGSRSATLTISSDAPSSPIFILNLSGLGVTNPILSLQQPAGSPLPDTNAQIHFGALSLGDAPALRSFTVANLLAGSRLQILSLSLHGEHPADFTLDRSTLPSSVLGGSPESFTVAFRPLADGPRSALLTLATNDPLRPSVVVALSGSASAVPGPRQDIFGPDQLPPVFTPGGSFTLPFASTSGLPLSYEIVAGSDLGSISGSSFIPSGPPGSVTLRITQPGAGSVLPAPPLYRSFLIASGRFAKIARGPLANHAAGIKQDGTLWTWGENSNGQLGLGHFNNSRIPAQVGSDADWDQVVLGPAFTLAIKTDGSLWAWGLNTSGQLGLGNLVSRSLPAQVLPGSTWTQVTAGTSHAMAIRSNGTLWGWGSNSSSQLGLLNPVIYTQPSQVGSASTWLQISAGSFFTLGIQTDNSLWAWGQNVSGQLGIGSNSAANTPARVGSGNNWLQVSCGNSHTLALQTDRSLWAWGLNSGYQLGNGSTTSSTSPVRIGTQSSWADIATGASHGVALHSDGSLWTWGTNSPVGFLAQGSSWSFVAPTRVGSAKHWLAASGGASHTLALLSDGSLSAAGLNSSGQLAAPLIQPVRIASGGVREASIGLWRSHFIRADGSLWGVGSNIRDLGDGTTIPRRQPVRIGVHNDWLSVVGGSNMVFALRSPGSLWACGSNSDGQLGDGSLINRSEFVRVGSEDTWRQIAAGSAFACGIQNDGSLWSWGLNSSGQLGLGHTSSRSSPSRVGSSTDWAFVACGGSSVYAIKTDGSLWAWGANSAGQLGLGDANSRSLPVRVGTGTDWIFVTAGSGHAVAMKADRSLWSVGFNASGQLGLNDTSSRSFFTPIGSDSDWHSVVALHNHCLAIKSDGTLWGWGSNTSNQLGDGSGLNLPLPTRIGNASTWSRLATGSSSSSFSLAITQDGSLWGFGANSDAQLSDSVPLNSFLNTAHPSTSTQTLSVEPLLVTGFGVPLPLPASSTSGLPLSFSVSGPASINPEGTHITVHGPGRVKILAWQPGSYPAWAGSNLVQMTVIHPPEILAHPVIQIVSEFGSASFSVSADSVIPMTYQWRRNGLPIDGATGSSLSLDPAQVAQAGSYDVIVSNTVGSTFSRPATLAVISHTPVILAHPSHRILRPGEPFTLSVSALGSPPLRYQWRKDGRAIPGATGPSFTIPSADAPSAGAYSVTVTARRSITSSPAQITIVPDAPLNVTTSAGSRSVLKPAAFGPARITSLYLDAVPLSPSPRLILSPDARSLSIQDSRLSDVGAYHFLITAPGGSLLSGPVNLSLVTGPPLLASPLDFPPGSVGAPYTFQPQWDASPELRPSSFRASGLPPGLSIQPGTGLILGIPTRAGSFPVTITALNARDSSSSTGSLTIAPLPSDIQGSYSGLIDRHPAISSNLGGRIDFQITSSASLSGSLLIGRTKLPFRGSLTIDAAGLLPSRFHAPVIPPGNPSPPPFQLSFELQPQSPAAQAAGTLVTGVSPAAVNAWRKTWHAAANPASSYAAYHTFHLEPDPADLANPAIPHGTGFGSFIVSPAGTLKVAARLADGTSLSLASFLSPHGRIPLYSTLYQKSAPGSLLGLLDLGLGSDPALPSDNPLSGSLSWLRPPGPGQTYAGGFGPVSLSAVGGAFNPPALLLNVSPLLNNVRLRFLGGGLASSPTSPDLTFTVGLGNRVTINSASNPAFASFKPQPSTGLFSGAFSLSDPGWPAPAPARWTRKASCHGIIIQSPAREYLGAGFFLLPDLPPANPGAIPPKTFSGQVIFEPAP